MKNLLTAPAARKVARNTTDDARAHAAAVETIDRRAELFGRLLAVAHGSSLPARRFVARLCALADHAALRAESGGATWGERMRVVRIATMLDAIGAELAWLAELLPRIDDVERAEVTALRTEVTALRAEVAAETARADAAEREAAAERSRSTRLGLELSGVRAAFHRALRAEGERRLDAIAAARMTPTRRAA